MTMRIERLVACGGIALALSLAPARAADTEPGVWWEQTIEMSMQGMSMPATTQRTCVPKKGMTEPPGAARDERCKVSDVKTVGSKMTWKMECSEPERMTGEGEITRGKDTYAGSMAMHSARGDMTMKMKGKLVGGDCDAGAVRKQVAAIQKQQREQQAQSEQAMAQACDQAIDEVQLRMFSGPLAMCKKPEQAASVCARMSTREGYAAYRKAAQDPEVVRIGKELCRKDPETVRAELCQQAAAEASAAAGDAAPAKKKAPPGSAAPQDPLGFLAGNCPDESRALAQKVCAGRSFTGMPENVRGICVEYAREELSKGGEVQPAKGEPAAAKPEKKGAKEQATEGATKALKGLFGK